MIMKCAATVAATLLLAAPVAASTLSPTANGTYTPSSAIGSGSDHSVWLTVFNQNKHRDFDFGEGASFVLDDDGALLTGDVFADNGRDGGFTINFEYTTDLPTYASADGEPEFKSENGSQENASTSYLHLVSGLLTGFGVYENANFVATAFPDPANDAYATQLGFDANNKNDNLGLANWFTITAAADCTSWVCDQAEGGVRGDVNIDLAPVPLPAAGFLLLAALGGMGVAGRRSRKSA